MDERLREALTLTLDDTERQIDELQRFARHLRSRLGNGGDANQSVGVPTIIQGPPPVPDGLIVSPGDLAGKTSREGAIHVLRNAGQPLATKEVLRLLRRGGIKLDGKYAHATLRRNLHAEPVFVSPTPGMWTLAPEAGADEGEVG
jgi:hypothetical protein